MAVSLGAVEAGFGGLIHSLHLPFGGHFLSLNQGFFLSRFSFSNRSEVFARRLPLQGSVGAALLKSFSPAGKKLTPMLAISVQGFLFSLGTLVFGANPLGIVIGFVLLSLWAFVQQPIMVWLMFGNDLLKGFEKIARSLADNLGVEISSLVTFLLVCVGVKVFLAIVLSVVSIAMPDHIFLRYQNYLMLKRKGKHPLQASIEQGPGLIPNQSLKNSAGLALKDLFNRWFLVSMVLTLGFLVFSEAPFVQLLWVLLRAVTIGFLMFFLIRVFPIDWLAHKTANTRFGTMLKGIQLHLGQVSKETKMLPKPNVSHETKNIDQAKCVAGDKKC